MGGYNTIYNKIECTLINSDKDNFKTKYYLDGIIKVMSFVTGFHIIFSSLLLFSQNNYFFPPEIILFITALQYVLFGAIIIKLPLMIYILALFNR